MNKLINRCCYNCGKEYTYFPHNPEGAGLRRCADCMKLPAKEIKWCCPCGKIFDNRADFYNHRREVKESGKYCGAKYNKPITGSCPFCGKVIRTSKNKETRAECYYNHTCEGVEAAKAIGVDLEATIEMLGRLRDRNRLSNKNVPVGMDKLLQLSWVQSVYDKYHLPQDVCMSDNCLHSGQRIFSYLTKSIFIFDDNVSNTYIKYFKSLKWNVFSFKWADCILNTDVVENEIIEKLKDYEKQK